jgi:hypothetical protein
MCDVLMARVFNPLFHLDTLFHLSPTGRRHDRNLVTLHGMTNRVIKMRRQKMLQAPKVATEFIDNTGKEKY